MLRHEGSGLSLRCRGKFLEKARELETDESEEHFDALVKKIAQAKHAHDEAVDRAGKVAVVWSKKR